MAAPTARPHSARCKLSLRRRETLWFYLLILPWILGFLLFQLGPLLVVAYFSCTDLTDLDLNHLPHWVGFVHYGKLFTNLAYTPFRASVRATAIYVFGSVPAVLLLALLAAQLLNQNIPFRGLLRLAYCLPIIATGVVGASLWRAQLNPGGAVEQGLSALGLGSPDWFDDAQLAMVALIAYQCWFLGSTMVIFLAGFQGIPPALYEAAAIDGAGPIRRFVSITLPLLSPLILLAAVIGMIGTVQDYTNPAVLTNGGPDFATWVSSIEIFQNAITYSYTAHTAVASAEAMLLFLAVLALTLMLFVATRRIIHYTGDHEDRL